MRYKQTFLGVAWAILVPIFTAVVYVIVFGKFANFPSGDVPYPSLVIAGVLPMQYFASALTGSSMSLAANLQLVTKVYFPRTLLPLAAVIVPLVDFVVGLPVLLALMWYYDTLARRGWRSCSRRCSWRSRSSTALGCGLFLSAVNVRFRDVRYMIPVFLQVLPLLSGVMYAVDQIPVKWQWVLVAQPDDDRDQRLALGRARRARPGSGSGCRRRSASRDSSSSSAWRSSARPSRRFADTI